MARLKWWWKEIELVEHKEGLPPESKKLSKILNEMLEDVANPDDPTLGPINASFGSSQNQFLKKLLDRSLRIRLLFQKRFKMQ